MLDPIVFVGLERLDGLRADVAQVADAVGDPVDMLFDGLYQAREHRRAARSCDHEHVRESFGAKPEVGAWPGLPFFAECQPALSGDPDPAERARHGVETRGANDRVQRIFRPVRHDPLPGEAFDRTLGDVDQLDMRQVVGLEIAGVHAQPLAAKNVVRTQQRSGRRVLHERADLAARKIRDGVVGFLLEQQIAIRAEKRQAATRPGFLVLAFAFFGRCGERRLHAVRKINPGRPSPCLGTQCRVVGLGSELGLRADLGVAGRHRIRRRALEHRQRGGLARDHRDRLDR